MRFKGGMDTWKRKEKIFYPPSESKCSFLIGYNWSREFLQLMILDGNGE